MATPHPSILVIGYGNSLRSDDSAGLRVAEAIRSKNDPQLTAIAVHQLTPELADVISKVDAVIFVDAATDSEAVQLRSVVPETSGSPMAHVADPAGILSLATIAFDVLPRAWQVSIPADDLDFGETISERARIGISDALLLIESLAQSLANESELSQPK